MKNFIVMLFATSVFALNINTANVEELTKIKGVNEVKAKLIVKYREDNGAFKNFDELKNVKGISDEIIENIRFDIKKNI